MVGVRVLAARSQGRMPSDWELSDAPLIVSNLNAVSPELALSFSLESAAVMDVSDPYATIAATFPIAKAAIDHYVSTGAISNRVLNVVVVNADPSTWVGGWGNNDQPLNTVGSWPVITSTAPSVKGAPHWIAHELGHVLGYYDTTNYKTTPTQNLRYTRCGLSIDSTTFPRDIATQGYKENFMSYDVDVRRAFFTDGLADDYRRILACWVRTSRL